MKHKVVFRLSSCVCILIAALALSVFGAHDARGAGLRTGGVPLQIKQAGFCSALTPADWVFWTSPTASTAEALSVDGTLYSGWASIAVDKIMQPLYGNLFGDPYMSIQFMTNRILWNLFGDSSRMRYTAYRRPFLDYFTLNHFESDQTTGLVFHRIYPGRSQDQYTESVYWAIARKFRRQEGLRIAAGVTVSIRCVTQFGLLAQGQALPMRVGPARAGCGAGEALRRYQKELGIQAAHSALTRRDFLMDPSTDWNETGPHGPGYYQRIGTGYEKLEIGYSDGC